MQQDIPSYAAILDTLRLAEQGYVTGPDGTLRPMPWRRILDHLSVLGPGELLHIASNPNGIGSGVAVRHIVANGRAGSMPSERDIPEQTVFTVDIRKGLRARARFAQRVEMAVRSGECADVTCVRKGSRAIALTTGARAVAPSNGRWPRSAVVAASLLLSVVALASAVTGLNRESPLPPSTNAIVGQVLIEGRGANGVTIVLDGRAATATTGAGVFRIDAVEAGAHTITISNYPANARFTRTSATATIDGDGGTATVNFSGSYVRMSPVRGTLLVRAL